MSSVQGNSKHECVCVKERERVRERERERERVCEREREREYKVNDRITQTKSHDPNNYKITLFT